MASSPPFTSISYLTLSERTSAASNIYGAGMINSVSPVSLSLIKRSLCSPSSTVISPICRVKSYSYFSCREFIIMFSLILSFKARYSICVPS